VALLGARFESWSRAVAIIGVYAIALQLLLSGFFGASQVAWADGESAICPKGKAANNRIDHLGGGRTHAPCCGGCIMTSCAAVGGSAGGIATFRPRLVTANPLREKPSLCSHGRLVARPHNARAPPT
jgi:hypothetical protein